MSTGRADRRLDARSSPTGDAGHAGVILSVRKRDGRLVPYQRHKVTGAILAAMEAQGASEPEFAAEIAAVVELTLLENQRRRLRRPEGEGRPSPGIEEIQDLVERALMELGRPAIAKAYILYRESRARIREALQVHRSDTLRSPVRVREAEGVSSWSKGRIVAALMGEAEVPRELAEEIAGAVEVRVFASGLRRITTGLVRELVAGELFERGRLDAVASLGSVGISRHDLRRILRAEPLRSWEASGSGAAAGAGIESRVAGEILRRHALDDVVSEGIGELHRSGDLHVEDLNQLHRPLALALDAELLAAGGHSTRSAFGVLDGAADLARCVSRVLVLEHPGAVLAPLVRSVRAGSPLGLSGWLRSLAAVARAAGIRIDLGSSGARFPGFNARLIEELAELPAGPHAPRLYLEGHELEALLADNAELAPLVERLFAEGRLASTWGEDEARFAAPGCRRLRRESGLLSCGAAVALNLPRLARRAGPFREGLVQSGLAELVQASLDLFRELDRFQAEHDAIRSIGLHVRRSYAIVPVGLREALRILGDGEIDPDQGARLLGLLNEAASRFATGGPLVVAPCSAFGERAAQRFAFADHQRARAEGAEQRWLFADAAGTSTGGGLETPVPYTADLRLSPVPLAPGGRFEAEVQKTLPSGALSMVGIPGRRDASDATPHLSAWRRFEVLRRAKRGEVVLELFPPPRPSLVRTAATPATSLD